MKPLALRRIAASSAFVAALVLAGCGAPDGSTATVTSSAAAPSSSPTVSEAEQGYLLNVRHAEALTDWSDEALIQAARAVCAVLDDGALYEEAVAPLRAQGVDEPSAQVLAATAVFEFCDQHDAVIEVQLGGATDPQAEPTGEAGAGYLGRVREDPFNDGVTDDALVMLGTAWCDDLTRGDTVEQVLERAVPLPEESARHLLHAAVEFICPQHADKVP